MCDLLPSRKVVFYLNKINYAFKIVSYDHIYHSLFWSWCVLGGIDNVYLVRYGR